MFSALNAASHLFTLSINVCCKAVVAAADFALK